MMIIKIKDNNNNNDDNYCNHNSKAKKKILPVVVGKGECRLQEELN